MSTLGLNTAKFTLEVEGLSEELRVTGFHGEEGISRLFGFTIDIAAENDALDFDTIVEKSATLVLHDADGGVARNINGIVVRVEQRETRQRFTSYQAVLVPRLWLLTGRNDSRIFQAKSVPDIIKEVLDEGGLLSDQYALQLKESYEAREYCVQYRESDLNFLSRLMEEEGIFYFFEHQQNAHKLIIADDASTHKPVDGDAKIVFRSGDGMVPAVDAITNYRLGESARTASVTLRDYNFKKPNLNLEVQSSQGSSKIFNVYDYPGKYELPELGNKRAKVRLQTIQRGKRVGAGATNCMRLIPGCSFSLAEHPRFDGEYVVTKIVHDGTQPQAMEELADGATTYNASFTTIPGDVVYRGGAVDADAARKPRVEGPQTAFVVGPAGEEIYTDEHGRIKVQFHWDRDGKRDEKTSCWVRVSQTWAGAGWGAWVLPRIEQEVIVEFLEGDPDRPIVTGCVYHGTNRPPYALPEHKTRSTFKTNSTPGGGGFNELRFEDKKDQEEIYIHGQKDWTIQIRNDKNQNIGHDETLHVGNDRTKTVDNNQTEAIGKNKTISVGENHSESVGKNASITVGSNETINIGEDRSLIIGSNQTTDIGKNQTIAIGSDRSVSVGGRNTIDIGKDATWSVGNNFAHDIGSNGDWTVAKDMHVNVGKKLEVTADTSIKFSCGSASIELKSNGKIVIEGGDIAVKGSGNITLKGSKISQN